MKRVFFVWCMDDLSACSRGIMVKTWRSAIIFLMLCPPVVTPKRCTNIRKLNFRTRCWMKKLVGEEKMNWNMNSRTRVITKDLRLWGVIKMKSRYYGLPFLKTQFHSCQRYWRGSVIMFLQRAKSFLGIASSFLCHFAHQLPFRDNRFCPKKPFAGRNWRERSCRAPHLWIATLTN